MEPIIGYIHVCQKGNWQKSYDILMNSIKKNGLYNNTTVIRIGVVNDNNGLIDDERFHDPKIKIIYVGKSELYERPTLLHMKASSYTDHPNTMYYYLHTKGIRHFNKPAEPYVLKWIHDMLYWNIELWNQAIHYLKTYDTYGCNYNNNHYSGNFWWATAKHIQTLPNVIPEDWVTINTNFLDPLNNEKGYCANNCYPNFTQPYPSFIYN